MFRSHSRFLSIAVLVIIVNGNDAWGESAICRIEPSGGHVSGGTEVTIWSRVFLPPEETRIVFDTTPVLIVNWRVHGYDCLYAYTCIAPPHQAGSVDISILVPGRDTEILQRGFAYYERPQLFLANVPSGGVSGMNVVTFDGSGFLPPVSVYFGGLPATVLSLKVNQLTCLSPPHSAGVVGIQVVNADGVSSDDFFDQFEYKFPSVLSVWPRVAPSYTPNRITIYGAGFGGKGMKVMFGSVEAQDVTVESSTALNCLTPLGITGPVQVSVQDENGNSATSSLEFNFTDTWESMIHGFYFDFNSSTTAGIRGILIKGENLILDGDYQVYFGDTPATGIRVPYPVNLYCDVPPHEPGTVDVTVYHDGKTTLVPGGWTYYEEPVRTDADQRAAGIELNDEIVGNNDGAITDNGRCYIWWVKECQCTQDEADVYYTVSSLESGLLSVDLCSDFGDKTLRIYSPSGLVVECADGVSCTGDASDDAQLQIPMMPCTPFSIRVASVAGAPVAPFTLTTAFEPDGVYTVDAVDNDEPGSAVPLIDGVSAEVDLKCTTSTSDVDSSIPGADSWFLYEAPDAGILSINICGEFGLPSVTVHGPSLGEIGGGMFESCATPVLVNLPAAGSYYLRAVRELRYSGVYNMVASFSLLPSDGEVEGIPDGAGEGELLEGGSEGEANPEGLVDGESEGDFDGAPEGFPEGGNEGAVDGETSEGSNEGEVSLLEHHSADVNRDSRIDLGEVLRVVQLYNARGYHCLERTEDGFAPGESGLQTCPPHTADYSPRDWKFSLTEVLRVIQIRNSAGYVRCPEGESGFCLL